MSKIKILFDIEYIYHKAALDPVMAAFAADPKFDIAITLGKEPYRRWGLFKISKRADFLPYLDMGRMRWAKEHETFDAVFVGDTKRDAEKFGQTLLCFVNHGTGIKNVLYRNLRRHPGTKYMIFVEGDFRVEQLESSGALGESEIFKIGLPKLDPCFQPNDFNREAILTRYGLDPAKKSVLFAPTYKPTCIHKLKNHIFTQTTDYNLIIKLHHYSWMGKHAPHSHHRIFERRVAEFPHSTLVPVHHYNILPLMAAADTLLSEASSTVFDFLALKKLGIIYDLDHDRMRHSDGEHVLSIDNREFLKGAFAHINRPEMIGDAVKQALNPTAEMVEKADRYRDYYFYRLDGRASLRLKETVESLLAEGTHANMPSMPPQTSKP